MRAAGAALKTPSLPAAIRALEVLERVTAAPEGLTLTQFTQLLGYPRSSVHCLLVTLERAGYLQRSPEAAAYLPGPRLAALSVRAFPDAGLARAARPLLMGLMWRTGLVVHMAVLANDQVTLIAQQAPPEVKLSTWVGQRLDWHCTALGKAIAAHSGEARVDQLMQSHALARHNENTIVSTRRLRAELDASRERGYAIDDEENLVGIRCLAVPVFVREGEVAAAISLMGSTTEICETTAPRLVDALVTTAARVTQQF